jgi:hypothetical protein
MNIALKLSLFVVGLVLTCGLVCASEEQIHVYHKVTPCAFSDIKSFTENYGNFGINVPDGNEGDISCMGATVHFTYDGCECLKLQITQKPFFVGSDLANSKLDKFVNQFI